ncbi:Protein PDC2 [Nakaseomyces bracarensis]|uniref:Protein PDC2 n=1 Tax=Nakaseomyces bracarensis TaxID=273131 RepID=A0ABR4NXS5_9SACH
MLSIEQRYNICLMAERHPKWTQLELAKWAYDTFQLPKIPSQGTISRLLARKSTYMNCKEHEKDANRIRTPNNILVRRILQEWISQSLWNGIPITSPIIQGTAQSVWHRIPSEFREGNGSFSYKWITNFLAKMDVNISSLDEELPKTPKVWTFEERSALKQLFSKVPPKDLYTLDETFIAYNLPLDYAQYEASKIQRRIEVATVMLCSNLDGSDKMKPVVVGRYNSYKSFKNYFPDEPMDPVSQSMLGQKMAEKFNITYHSNRKSWLTSNLFHNWLAQWDKRLGADNRKIWIVIDDSCSHRIVNIHLKHINLIYTSANSRFLPFNWGVLDEFKTRYRIQQYQALIELQRRLESQLKTKEILISFEQSQLTMSNAFKFINRAWAEIPIDTIKANWKSSGLVPNEMIRLNETVSMAFKKNKILEAELEKLCNEYHCEKKWDYEMLLDLNIENKNTNFLSTEELVESAIVENYEPDVSEGENIKALQTYIVPQLPENHDHSYTASANLNLEDMSYRKNSIPFPIKNENYNKEYMTQKGENNDNADFSNSDVFGQSNIFDVSTLIDKSTIFMDSNDDNIDFNNVAVDLPISSNNEFINEFFGSTMPSNTTTTAPSAVDNGFLPLDNQLSNTITNENKDVEITPPNSNNQNNSSPLDNNNLQHIIDLYGTSPDSNTSSIGFKSINASESAGSPLNNIIDSTTLKNDLEIANSLQILLKHVSHNHIKFNKRTVKQLSTTYQELVKKVKKSQNQQAHQHHQQQQNQEHMKQKPNQFKFDDLFMDDLTSMTSSQYIPTHQPTSEDHTNVNGISSNNMTTNTQLPINGTEPFF